MNNRKTTNKRGKNPRAEYSQITPEAKEVKGKLEDGTEIKIPNPYFGKNRTIIHRNLK